MPDVFKVENNVITMPRAGEAVLDIYIYVPVLCNDGGSDCSLEFLLFDEKDNYTCEDSTLAIKVSAC